jgi:hypothetical protein
MSSAIAAARNNRCRTFSTALTTRSNENAPRTTIMPQHTQLSAQVQRQTANRASVNIFSMSVTIRKKRPYE